MVKPQGNASRRPHSDSDVLTTGWDRKGNLWKRHDLIAQTTQEDGRQLHYSPELIRRHERYEAARRGQDPACDKTPTAGLLSQCKIDAKDRLIDARMNDTNGWAMARTPPGPAGTCAPADPAASGATTPTKLYERRTTHATPQAIVGLAGSASSNSVAGHSGVDHPLSCGTAGLSGSFGEVLSPHQLQLGGRGEDGVLSTPLLPIHTGTEERQGLSLIHI